MNPVVDEMRAILEDDNYLEHIGMPRRSGRYPWGSGDTPYQRTPDLLSRIDELKKKGWTETPDNIMKEFGLTTGEYRIQKANVQNERDILELKTIKSMKGDGLSNSEIGRRLGINESSVRSKLDADREMRLYQAQNTADFLRKQVNEKGPIDIGVNVELNLGISSEKLKQAVEILQTEGYEIRGGRVDQATNSGQKTTLKVLFPPGASKDALYKALETGDIHSVVDYVSKDGGDTYQKKFTYPSSMDSKRLKIRYNEEGGIEKDGVIEIRRGVDDLSLGESRYSQVRILVDGTHYLKGMAVYSDGKDMPDGVDVIFNTNKTKGTPMTKVLKEIKADPDNPFGSAIKDADQGGQYWYDGKDGQKHLGLINKRADEGDWTEWKDALPSQFLSKQSLLMAQKQLNLAIADKKAEYDSYNSLTNPTVKKYFLNKFAEECDSAAVHLQAAALPGQKYHVIIPITSMKDTEVFAPNYEDGTKLALIRYPHGGTFEIPVLTVNNKQSAAKKLLGLDVGDAIGINSKVAERLSGADFDGDTVMCIPTNDRGGKVKITSTKPLAGLEGFDPKTEYGTIKKDDGYYSADGRKVQIMRNTQTEMGKISNLISDMTILGAGGDELAAAVRHSMVVIDAEKHKLDYKKSEVDNNIAGLKKEWQNGGGASTLISRSKGQTTVLKRQGSPIIDPETGKVSYKLADDLEYQYTKTNKRTGEVELVTKQRTQRSTKMAETDDAMTLVSDARTPMELAYADYANSMKSLGNQARKEMMSTGKIKYSAAAKDTYRSEVDSLNSKLTVALKNAPLERMAQIKTYSATKAKQADNPDIKTSELKKTSQQALSRYRDEVGSVSRKERSIKITDNEWAAIQAGAISENVLSKILANTDVDNLRQRAMPTESKSLSSAQIAKIKAMSASYTLNQIADKMNISASSVSKYLKGSE